MRKTLLIIGITLIAIYLILIVTGNGFLIKGLRATYLRGENSATIGDATFFDTKPIETGNSSWDWPIHPDYNKNPLPERLSAALKDTESVAFLVIRDDSILHEYYWDGYSAESRSNSFSAAKTVVTMLVQIAIQKGQISGWDQKVKDYLPWITGEYSDELKLWHLSTMSSGLDWDESYKNPFSITAKAYYGEDIQRLMQGLPIVDEPGQFFNYQSGSTQLLGLALMEATNKSLSELASEWLWKPLQAKNEARWHNDDSGTELAYCCFNTNARDFARFGRMSLRKGNWNGNQILDTAFVEKATEGALVPYYGYGFWIADDYDTKVFYHRGILGQYIITIPEYNLVMVRLGHRRNTPINNHPGEFRVIVEEMLKVMRSES